MEKLALIFALTLVFFVSLAHTQPTQVSSRLEENTAWLDTRNAPTGVKFQSPYLTVEPSASMREVNASLSHANRNPETKSWQFDVENPASLAVNPNSLIQIPYSLHGKPPGSKPFTRYI